MDEVEGTPERTPDELADELIRYLQAHRAELERLVGRIAKATDRATREDLVSIAVSRVVRKILGDRTRTPPIPPTMVRYLPAYVKRSVWGVTMDWVRKEKKQLTGQVEFDDNAHSEAAAEPTGRLRSANGVIVAVLKLLAEALENDDVAQLHELIGELDLLCAEGDPELHRCLSLAQPVAAHHLAFLLTRFPLNDSVAIATFMGGHGALEERLVASARRITPSALATHSARKDDLMPALAIAAIRVLRPNARTSLGSLRTDVIPKVFKSMPPECASCVARYQHKRSTVATEDER